MSEFHGFLFSKLRDIGTRSEGPAYFLQQFDYHEIPLEKHTQAWEIDQSLQDMLGTKVTITGEISEDILRFSGISLFGG